MGASRSARYIAALTQGGSVSDPLARLASLKGPTGDIDKMLSEIEPGRS